MKNTKKKKCSTANKTIKRKAPFSIYRLTEKCSSIKKYIVLFLEGYMALRKKKFYKYIKSGIFWLL